ncbi:MAG TPA: MerR family transcriptional regulator [bacterium]|jgi:MerR family transcriptional regulator/heat shock protein HspR|nr:MerR family transcriptional regulator [bacterium]HOK29800.1 MerR family transcriptional regulator [bacterium]HOL54971.1 MerR family transcriptional regulator [bacterium]HON72602.1 MerR family transcriptional regulator [bacterium]HOP55091.1 MerR family transcriptional regulator [bacterium]
MDKSKEPVYLISVTARLLGVHPRTLRIYEEWGLVTPKRIGNRRFYSEEDLEKLRLITCLTSKVGMSLAGVKLILRLEEELSSQDMGDVFIDILKEILENF